MKDISEDNVIELYEWYDNLEHRLKIILEIIPFSNPKDLRKITSPRLVPIMVESASIVDSVFRTQFPDKAQRPGRKSPITRREANIKDFFRILEPDLKLRETSSLFMVSTPFVLTPFIDWTEDSSPKWWQSYNKLEHDRIRYSDKASLWNTLNALCGLHQIMTKISSILKYTLRFKWIQSFGYNPAVLIKQVSVPNKENILAFSKFFCTPLTPVVWKSEKDIKPDDFKNSLKLIEYLGRK